MLIGEFGMVYKAHIVWPKRTETVAVKTLKGKCYVCMHVLMELSLGNR